MYRPISGSPISAYMLKVGGSGHFDGELNSRQLFVQEYITYMKSLKGPRMDVDTIRMDSTRGIFGHTKIFGDVQIKQNLEVLGKTNLRGDLIAEKGFTFDGTKGISYAVNSGIKTFNYGNTTGLKPLAVNCAVSPQKWANHQFGGMLQIYDVDASWDYVPNSAVLNFQTFGTKSFIDASDGGNTGGGSGLFLNLFCGNDVAICTGQYGGTVQMGKNVEIGLPTSDLNTTLNIKAINGANTKALSIKDATDKEIFYIGTDGSTAIGDNYVPAGYMLAVKGKIISEEVLIQLKASWPDYVFNKSYNLTPLEDVEKYIQKNYHLQGFATAKDYEKNGANTSELLIKQQEKLEELTLYIIELNKRIKELEKK